MNLIAGDEIVAELSKEPKNVPDDDGDEPGDPESQLHKEVEKLSAPLKVRHVTLMEPVMSRGVQHVLPAMDRIMTRMKSIQTGRKNCCPQNFGLGLPTRTSCSHLRQEMTPKATAIVRPKSIN